MAATPTTAVFSFKGIGQFKRNYSISAYISDVANAKVRFNANGAAGASSDEYVQFNEPVMLTDVSVITGYADTSGMRFQSGGVDIPQSATLFATNLTTLQARNAPPIAFAAQSQIGAIQF